MKYIDILNSCMNKIKFQVSYFPKGAKNIKVVNSPTFEMGIVRTIQIPDDANTVLLRVFFINSRGNSKEMFNATSTAPVTKCYETYGAVDNPRCHEIDCKKVKNQDYIYALNKSSDFIMGELIYTIGKEGIKETTIKIKPNRSFSFRIPQQAEVIQLKIYMIKEGIFKDSTRLIHVQVIEGRPLRRCFEITGNYTKSQCNSVKCPSSSLNETSSEGENCCCKCLFNNSSI